MSVVLVVEPDAAQASLLKKMHKRLHADVVVVKTTAAAIDAIDQEMPDVILLSALLSPRDEDRLITHLRALEGASHLQTLTIPQLRTEKAADAGSRKKGFSFSRKKREASGPAGCDPAVFADEIAVQLATASDLRSRPASATFPILISTPMSQPSAPEPMAAWESPVTFEEPVIQRAPVNDPWASERFVAAPVNAEPEMAHTGIFEPTTESILEPIAEAVTEPVEAVASSVFDTPVFDTAVFDTPLAATPDSIDDELDRLARELGVSLDAGMAEVQNAEVQNEESAERMAAEVALVQAETEAKLAAELERVRAEADQRRLAELARLQADADAMREAAIADARATAEEDTRRALASEVLRVRSETEGTVAQAVNRVKMEAEQTLSQEIGRAREDAAALRADLARAQEDATVTARALEAEVARVRAHAEVHLKAELERIGKDAERARAADQTHAKATADQIREAAAREARAIAEESARRTLDAEIARVRSQADTILETEVARVRAEAQELQAVQLLDLRAQMAEMREAAAKQAREVAEEARAAAKQARAAAARRPADVISFPVAEAAEIERVEVAHVEPPARRVAGERRDYYSLWQRGVAPNRTDDDASEETSSLYDYTHVIKWGLPVAASLLLIIMNSSDTVARFASPATVESAPKRVVTEVVRREVAAPRPSKFGTLKVESTPPGARITLDGESRGETPQTFSNLAPGSHMLILRGADGTITRNVTVRAGQTVIASEAIFAGWLAIFAPIPLAISLNGVPATPTEDGRFMIAPGTYRIEMVNTRFNFHRTQTLTVKPGGVTAHTVSLPTGTLKIAVPDGTDITVDGHPIGKAPFAELLPLVVGTHEIKASHPDLGERRTAVDVKFEETTEATIAFQP